MKKDIIFSYFHRLTVDNMILYGYNINVPTAEGDLDMLPKYHIDHIYLTSPLEFDDLSVFQIGRLYCTDSYGASLHQHSGLFELTIVIGGNGRIFSNGIGTSVKSGDIYLSMPHDTHEIVSDPSNPLKFDHFAFTLKNESFKADFEQIMNSFCDENSRLIHDARIQNAVANALAEIHKNDRYSLILLSAIFKQLMIYIIVDFEEKSRGSSSFSSSDAEILCYRIMNYIETHLFTINNLRELSVLSDYSYGYISTLFKKTTSMSLSEFFKEKKIEAARKLIADGKTSITQISQMLNYSSVYAFSKAFRNYYGISPKIYQMECRKSKTE